MPRNKTVGSSDGPVGTNISFTTKRPVDWSLRDLDHNILFLPQFPIDGGVRSEVGSNLSVQDRFGFQDPILQWTKGKNETFSFRTELYARWATENITLSLETIRKFAVKDSALGRPPICLFTYGNIIRQTVIVEHIDPSYEDVTSGKGNPRHIVLSIMLRKYTPFSQLRFDPSQQPKESFYLVASDAESSYEEIAKRFYGDPLYGDRLRKRNPAEPMYPTIGSKISVPSKSLILKEVVEPASHIFKVDDVDAAIAYRTIVDSRGERQSVLI